MTVIMYLYLHIYSVSVEIRMTRAII